MVEEHFFENHAQLFQALASRCEMQLMRAISQRGNASFFVSGGSTPAPLYEALSNSELDWSSVGVGLVDDRWVDPDMKASNERLVRETLLRNQAISATLYPMKQPDVCAKTAVDSVSALYQSKLSWPADLVILGMGPDGHTASLFPRAEGLEQGLAIDNPNVCCAIQATKSEVTGDYTERMSLTLSALRQSHELILIITGPEKLAVYNAAKEDKSNVADCPVSALLRDEDLTVSVYWAP